MDFMTTWKTQGKLGENNVFGQGGQLEGRKIKEW